MSKPKALIVASVASMIQQFNMPNIRLLLEMGYDVDVACNFIDSGTIPSSKSKELMENLDKLNVKYFQVDFDRNAFNFFKNMKAYKQMKKIMISNYDLVHSQSPIGGVIARITANKYRKKGLKSIYTAHGFHFYKNAPLKNWVLYYPVERLLSKFTDIIITLNEEDYKISQKFLKPKSTKQVRGVGVNVKSFQEKNILRQKDMKAKLKIKSDELVLMYIGELNDNKNQEFLIRVIQKLNNNTEIKFQLLLVGTGRNWNKYKNLCFEFGISNVKFLGYRDDIKDLLGITDIYVASSLREGLPVNILEAMSSGLPIVALDNRGHRELVKTGKNGKLVSVNSLEKFTEAVFKLSKDQEKRKLYGINSRKMASLYDIDLVLSQLEDVYKS